MKKSMLASLLVPILLAGCSDSSTSSGNSSSGNYKWQIVHLESVDESDLAARCVIYADSTEETDDSTIQEPEYQVITAYKADEDYNIIYHNADGSFDSSNVFNADELNDGLLSINPNDVPENGYVTLEELSGDLRDDNRGSYMFSVQKSLLTDIVLNIPQIQTNTDCITGDDHREQALTKFVNVETLRGELGDTSNYYQTSYDIDSIAGSDSPSDTPIAYSEGDKRDVLVTVFDDFTITDTSDSTETTTATAALRTNLLGWGFIDYKLLYDAVFGDDGNFELDSVDNKIQYEGSGKDDISTLDDVDLTDITWSGLGLDTITLDNESGVIAIHDDTTYLWQPIYDESTTITVAYETKEVDVWNSYFSGSVALIDGDWDFTSFNSLSEEPTSIDVMDFSMLTSLDNVTISNSCTDVEDDEGVLTTPDFCVDLSSNFDSDDFNSQRFHIRLQEVNGTDIQTTFQTIISPANSEPVILEANNVSFDTTTIPTLLRVELNLMKTDDDDLDAVQYLMSQNMDLVSLGLYGSNISDDAETNFYTDLDGYISTKAETEDLYQAVLKTNTTIVQSVYETP